MVFPFIRRIGGSVVVVLLTWTALDVLNPALCGLDKLPFVTASDSIAPGETPPAPSNPITPEDCFCCSHNLNFSAMVYVAMAIPASSAPPTAVVEHPLWTSIPLYHPPRFLG